ncbi:hypothetical protein CEXT_518501 [Caerostris extrusa]|uniref:Uncharacterized protein n=1 Tax=Caerostris extrusa TaxID=172846 RepID=A0AAV4TYD9_CAEEX|nr:hypothetical protein CEXT_518501 [Caerostris extrusa]
MKLANTNYLGLRSTELWWRHNLCQVAEPIDCVRPHNPRCPMSFADSQTRFNRGPREANRYSMTRSQLRITKMS